MLHRTAAFVAAIAVSNATVAAVLPPPSLPHLPDGQWMRGDLHVHDDHSSDGSGPRQALSQAAPGNNAVKDQIDFAVAHGLQFLPLTDHRTYDQHYDPLWASANLLLIRGEEANGSPHALVHGAVDSVVQGANPAGQPAFVNLQQSIWEAHAQDANWITAHPDDGETKDDGSPNPRASALGVDLIEVWNRSSNIDAEMAYAEGRWNAGYRTGISGASDDHFIEVWPVAGPGMPLTWVYAQPRERSVIDALRSGHTTISSDAVAPRLSLEADLNFDGVADAMQGDELVLPPNTRVQLIITIERPQGVTINLYQAPGKAAGAPPIEAIATGPLQVRQTFYRTITTGSTPTWIRAEARGPGLPSHYDISNLPLSLVPSPQQLPDEQRAITSPIFFSPTPSEGKGEIAVPADAGTADGATLVLGDAGVFNGFPDAASSNGVTHVVAEKHDGARSQITYRRRSGGVLGATISLTPNAQSARFPKVAARGNDVWIAYQDEPGSEQPHRSTIVLRHSSDGGLNWSGEQIVRAISGRCEHPALALTSDGKPVVAWQEISPRHPFDVMVQAIGVDPAPLNVSWDNDNLKNVLPALPTDSRSARYPASVWPALAVAPDGRVAVAWQDDRTDPDPLWTGSTGVGDGTDPDNWQIMIRLRSPGAAAWGRASTLGADDRSDRHPSIAFTSNGALTAAWSSKPLDSSGVNEAVLSSRSTNGVTWTAPAPIGFNANAQSIWPKLARGVDGRVRAAWHDSRSSDWRWRVVTAKQDLSGSWGAAQLIPSRGVNTWPALGGSTLVFASTRNATRLQRDRTQQIFAIDLP
ncbi:MAG TPA: CehA/McbA family metallohydrolase [Nevskiaceae bacterium]|nr:CehA/McbA family metallohydrolase [Nevskiaceae bacterium]